MFPAVGWVRASHVANENILAEINELRKNNSELQNSLNEISSQQEPSVEGMADIDSTYTVHGSYKAYRQGYTTREYTFESTITWSKMFALIAPYLEEHPNDTSVMLGLSIRSRILVVCHCERE